MVTNYRTPRKLNSVTIFMLLAAAAFGYWFYVFFPAYWDAWTVDHELLEGASECYKLSLLSEPERTNQMRLMLKKVEAKCIKLAHITDPDFNVALDIDGDNVVLRAEYSVRVTHPVGNYVSVVHMKRSEKANIKKVVWE